MSDKIQVVVATMKQKDFSKISEMNISSDVIFANQTDETAYCEEKFGDFTAKMISTQTKGVGINRNFGLQYASGDILLIADDDMLYYDGYASAVKKAFSEIPDADAIIFNIKTVGMDMGRRKNEKISRVRIYNCLNYGAARIAVRRSSLIRERLSFSTCFGGGTMYSAGEDSLFICDMLRKGFKIYTYPVTIAEVDQTSSTWFNGYDEKYIYDKGAFFGAAFGKNAWIMCLYNLLTHPKISKESGLGTPRAFMLMMQGAMGYKQLKSYTDFKNK